MRIADCNVVEGRATRVESRWFSFPRSAWERTTWPLLGDCAQNSTQSVEVLHTHAECGNEWHVGESLRDSHSHLGKPRPQGGFTLIELLVAITIIGILAALVLGVASVAGETAREQHTRHVVERLHTLLTDFYGTFKTRRVKLNPAVEEIISAIPNPANRGQALAQARLYALREMMLMEIPDRWSDVLLNAVTNSNPGNTVPMQPIYLESTGAGGLVTKGRTPLAAAYLRRFYQIAQNTTTDKLMQNQSAECLYMVITMACGDGEARTLFGENTIGDTDGDGAPEFLDGWGHPISFLRWAPGFDSSIQQNANSLDHPATGSSQDAWLNAATGDHDAYDVFRTDTRAFRLVPLVYSAGRDESPGIRNAEQFGGNGQYVAWTGVKDPAQLRKYELNTLPLLLPHALVKDPADGKQVYLGTAIDGTATDNVHNHLLGKR